MRLDAVTRAAGSIALATGVYAVSFGVLSVAAGLSVAQTCALSLLGFTGASQFTYVSVIASGASVASALPPAVLLAVRNGVYALSLKGILRGSLPRRAAEAQLVIDESTAMAHAQAQPDAKRRAFVLTGLGIFLTWNLGTVIGAIAGAGLGDPRDLGLDALFPAVFLALLWPQLQRLGARPAALAGAVVAVVLIPLTPAGVPVMAAALVAVPLVLARRRAMT